MLLAANLKRARAGFFEGQKDHVEIPRGRGAVVRAITFKHVEKLSALRRF